MKNRIANQVTRRECMLGLLALCAAPSTVVAGPQTNKLKQDFYVSAYGDNAENYGFGWVNSSARLSSVFTGFRGHGVVQHQLNRSSVIMFARRPGLKGIKVNLATGAVEGHFYCASGRHLLGHGCFSVDGKVLFTSEADYQNGVGKIGIRDALTFQLLGEYDSYGIGPHEIKAHPDGRTLVVANGGILTHPESGRKKLNLDNMDSTLTYIDVQTGQLLEQIRVPEPKASIRHLDVSDDGVVVFAMQIQRDAVGHNKTIPLAGSHQLGQQVRLFDDAEPVTGRMNDYMGSVAIHPRSRIAGFTSPKGNLVGFWHIDDHRFVGYHQLHDVCGIAVSGDQRHFIVSNSFGQLRQIDAYSLKEDVEKRTVIPGLRWDNHLLVATNVA